jgi:predicted MFS family arabinose efflux permease
MRLAQTLAPLRHRPFRRQFLAGAISTTGSSLAPVALAFGVLAATGSARTLGLVLLAYSIPMLVLMIVGGVWADRLPRPRLMMSADLVRFVTQCAFAGLLLSHHHPLWAMLTLQVIAGAATAFEAPATLGLTAATAPPGTLQQANALLAVTRDITGIAGPLIAGVLTVTVGAGWALMIDGISFLGSALLLAGLKLPPATRKETSFLTEVRDGWREVTKRSWLWASILYFATFGVTFAVIVVLGPARLAGTANGALSWGAITAGLSVGTLFGNALALRLSPRYLLRWPRIAELLGVPMIVALALGAPVPVLIVTAVLLGSSMTFPDALWYTALQQEIPAEALSRVSAFDFLGSFALRPLGYILAAALIAIGAQTALLAMAVLVVAATFLSLLAPGVRNLKRRPPEQDVDKSIVDAVPA